jgi:hypothetical protein
MLIEATVTTRLSNGVCEEIREIIDPRKEPGWICKPPSPVQIDAAPPIPARTVAPSIDASSSLGRTNS